MFCMLSIRDTAHHITIPCHPESCIIALKISVLFLLKIPPNTVKLMLHAYRKQGVALLSKLLQNLDHENREIFPCFSRKAASTKDQLLNNQLF